MCKIRYIEKEGNKVSLDAIIKISGSDFDVLNKPYYVSRIKESEHETFLFRYQDEEKSQGVYCHDNRFEITYGCKTGRLYGLKIKCFLERISNRDWTNLEKEIGNANLLEKPCVEVLLFGINIVLKIYQNQFQRKSE